MNDDRDTLPTEQEEVVRATAKAFFEAYLRKDIPACVALCDPLIRVTQHYTDPALPFTGESIGSGAMGLRLAQIFSEWMVVEARQTILSVEDEVIRTRCDMTLRHNASQETFEGTLRQTSRIVDGLIVDVDEYIDIDRLKAFLRLLGLPLEP